MAEKLNQAQKALVRLIRNHLPSQAKEVIKKLHPGDLKELFFYLSKAEQKTFTGLLIDSDRVGIVLSDVDEDELFNVILEELPEEKLVRVLQELSTDDAADIINQLDEEERERVFRKLTGAQKRGVGLLLGYGEDTAGGVMTTEVYAYPEDLTVGEVIEKLRLEEHKEVVMTVYVTDKYEHLLGVAPFRSLVFASSEQKLGEIMAKDPVSVQVDNSQEDAAQQIAQYDLLSLPVVDENGKLEGAITVDDAIDVMYEEATEDMFRLANLDAEEQVFSPVIRSIKLRLPWMLFNLLTMTCVAITVNFFKSTLESCIALAVLMPVIAGMGGNAGTQTLTVIVRGLALGEIDFKQAVRVLLKEARVGLIAGVIVGIAVGLISYAWFGNIFLGAIVCMAMIVNLILACLFGSIIPLGLRKFNLDPALGSSIFVTMIADIGGFVIFLGLAAIFMDYLRAIPV